MSTVWDDKTVRARKVHQCALCEHAIIVGAEHRSYQCADGESHQRIHEHLACYENAANGWDGLDYWDIAENGDFRHLIAAFANLDDALADLRGEVPPLPKTLDWQPFDKDRWRATWWRYTIIRRNVTWRGAIVTVLRDGWEVADWIYTHGNGPASGPAAAILRRAVEVACPTPRTFYLNEQHEVRP